MTSALRVMELEAPLPPQATLPTMYDLPSEEVGQPGMPDQFHEVQARLLSETFVPPGFEREEYFAAIDMNLYYDPHLRRCKRPDWFGVVGLPKENHPGMRLSYVVWQEQVTPQIVVELLSPSTQNDDLGRGLRDVDGTPSKWDVYEQWLRIPYYVTFNRRNDRLRIFTLTDEGYKEAVLEEGRLWLPEAKLGLGLWRGRYLGEERLWLRWYDHAGNWIPTPAERAEQLRIENEAVEQRAQLLVKQERLEKEAAQQQALRLVASAEQERLEKENAQQRAQRLADKLRALGIDPDQL